MSVYVSGDQLRHQIFLVQLQQFELHVPIIYGDRLLIIIFQRSAGTKGYTAAKIRVKLHFLGIILHILQNACSCYACIILYLYAVGIKYFFYIVAYG